MSEVLLSYLQIHSARTVLLIVLIPILFKLSGIVHIRHLDSAYLILFFNAGTTGIIFIIIIISMIILTKTC